MEQGALFENIKTVYRKISHAAMRSGREPDSVRLIAVTKTVAAGTILKAVEIGLRDFGENRVQEAREKISFLDPLIGGSRVVWHFIGHLQKNKARAAAELFDMIHSVDSPELAGLINDFAGRAGKVQDILIQIKLSPEEAKYGLRKEAFHGMLHEVQSLRSIRVKGLMTMPPFFDDPEMARPYFRQLQELRDDAEREGFHLPELSMGMSHDFEVAIEEGATIVRVGSAIFGQRLRQ